MSNKTFLHSLIMGVSLIASFSTGMARIPAIAFKGATAYFQKGKEFYSPTLGMAAIEAGLIYNLRFYGNSTAIYKTDANGRVNRYDSSNDPVWNVVHFFFPSPSGNLTTETESPHNFGKHVNSPKTVALLLNYAYQLRTKGAYTFTKAERPQEALVSVLPSSSHEVKKVEKAIKFPSQLQVPIETFITSVKEKIFKVTPEQEEVCRNYEKASSPESSSGGSKAIKVALNSEQIRSYLLHQNENKENKSPPLKKQKVFNAMERLEEDLYNSLNITQNTHRSSLKKNIKVMLKWIQEAIHFEKGSIYPPYTTEQIILAFFCERFNFQQDIWHLIKALDVLDVDHSMVQGGENLNPDREDLFQEEDLLRLAQTTTQNLDDLYLLANKDVFYRLTPYKPGTQPISNGSTWPYDRAKNEFQKNETFADCIEEILRHLCNILLYNTQTKQFDFSHLMAAKRSHQDPFWPQYLEKLVTFYRIQPPVQANTGDIETRSLWNTVVGDLNGLDGGKSIPIFYISGEGENTYELYPGFINIVNVARKLFNLDIRDSQHKDKEKLARLALVSPSLEEIQEWIEAYLAFIFETLNPKCTYKFDLSQTYTGKGHNYLNDVFGDIAITVSNQEGTQDLYSFTITLSPDHGEIINFQSLVSPGVDMSNSFADILVPQTSQESLKLLLPENRDEDIAPLYELYQNIIQDNPSRIVVIKKLVEWEDEKYDSAFANTLSHVLDATSWDDNHTLRSISVNLLRLANRFPEAMKNHVKGLFLHRLIPNDINLKEVLPYFSNLKFLKAIAFKRAELPLTRLVKLKKLTINQSDIKNLPGLENCHALESLEASGAHIPILPLTGLTNLRKLNISQSWVEKLPGLENCHALTKLSAAKTRSLETLPLTGLVNLKVLNISNSAVKILPGLENCHALEDFDVSKTTDLAELSLAGLSSLRVLSLSHSALQNLSGIESCPSLKEIYAEGINIDLPKTQAQIHR